MYQLTKVWERAPPEVELELVSGGAVPGVGDWLPALEVVLGAIVDRVGELVVAIEGAVGPSDGAAAVEALGLVKHHLGGFSLTDVSLHRARGHGRGLSRVALADLVSMNLKQSKGLIDNLFDIYKI